MRSQIDFEWNYRKTSHTLKYCLGTQEKVLGKINLEMLKTFTENLWKPFHGIGSFLIWYYQYWKMHLEFMPRWIPFYEDQSTNSTLEFHYMMQGFRKRNKLQFEGFYLNLSTVLHNIVHEIGNYWRSQSNISTRKYIWNSLT